MALVQRTRLYELLARVNRVGGADRVLGMHAVNIMEVVNDETDAIISATLQPAQPVDWDGLVALMHEDDRALLQAALTAAAAP